MSHGRYRYNPRRHKEIPKEFRAEYKRLKAAQKKSFRDAEPIERALGALFIKISKAQEKDKGTKIEIGRPGKKAESINIGGVDLLKLVKRVTDIEAYQVAFYKGAQKVVNALNDETERVEHKLDSFYERLEKSLVQLSKKTKRK
jgi:hypothetical protein